MQRMARPGVEAIVGVANDATFGPVLMFGLGGVFVEILKDVSFRSLPISASDARDMIEEIKGYALLRGYRGYCADIPALEELLLSEQNACPHCDLSLPALSPALFSFNAPTGMCPECNGLGSKLEVDPALIIEHPEWQTLRQRTLYASITLIFWMAWGYLWTPLLTFAAWAFGLTKTYEHMVTLEGYRGLLRLFGLYLLVIVCMGGSLLAWAFYNYFRFRGIERRRQRPARALRNRLRRPSHESHHDSRHSNAKDHKTNERVEKEHNVHRMFLRIVSVIALTLAETSYYVNGRSRLIPSRRGASLRGRGLPSQ